MSDHDAALEHRAEDRAATRLAAHVLAALTGAEMRAAA